MPRPESQLREGDKIEATPQRSFGSDAPQWSIVVRLCPELKEIGNDFIVVDYPPYIGIVPNPEQWARWIRYDIDNPPSAEVPK